MMNNELIQPAAWVNSRHDSQQKQLKEIITHEKRNGNIKAIRGY